MTVRKDKGPAKGPCRLSDLALSGCRRWDRCRDGCRDTGAVLVFRVPPGLSRGIAACIAGCAFIAVLLPLDLACGFFGGMGVEARRYAGRPF